MPGVNKKPTSKSFNAVTPHRRSARRLCTSAPCPTGSCYGTKPTRGTLDLHHSKYNDTKLTRKSVTYVVELKCYPCEWRAQRRLAPPISLPNRYLKALKCGQLPPKKLFNGNIDGFFDGDAVFVGELVGERIDTAESGGRGVHDFSLVAVKDLAAMGGFGEPENARALGKAQ